MTGHEMTGPTVQRRSRSGNRASARVLTRAWLATVGVLAIAIVGLQPRAASAQQLAQQSAQQLDSSTPPAPSTTTRPEPPKNPASSFDVNVGASITSDYNYRGYTLSDHRPSVSNNIEATYNIFFAGVNTASVQMPNLSQFQMTDYAGIRPTFGQLTVEAGVAYFTYPGSAIDISYPEYYVAPTYALTSKLSVGLNAYFAPDYSRTGAWENYNSIQAKYTFDSGLAFSGELGRQGFGTTKATASSLAFALPDYTYWNLGFAYTYKVLTFDLRYFATTLSKQNCFLITGTGQPGVGSNGCEPAVIATMSWNANLSGLK
jgi:uncharacterized protein (TIGR02001 family)